MSKYLKEGTVRQAIVGMNKDGITQVAPDVYEALDQEIEKILLVACHRASSVGRKKLRVEDVEMIVEGPLVDYDERERRSQD